MELVQKRYENQKRQESTNLSGKEPLSKYLRLCEPYGLCHNDFTLPLWAKAATGNKKTNQRGCVPIKRYFCTLKSEFHIIFTYHKKLFFDFFENHLQM